MKTTKVSNTLIAAFFVAATFTGSYATAGTKVKPPVVEQQVEDVWYQPLLDWFNF